MSVFISQMFCVQTKTDDHIEIFVNSDGNVWVGSSDMTFGFTINKEEWELLKDFLDNQFKTVENG